MNMAQKGAAGIEKIAEFVFFLSKDHICLVFPFLSIKYCKDLLFGNKSQGYNWRIMHLQTGVLNTETQFVTMVDILLMVTQTQAFSDFQT